jgi:dTDP-4-amino-4,6-dideoxygalactose transaminase
MMVTVRGTVGIPKQPVLERGAIRKQPTGLPSLLDLPNKALTRSGRSAIVMALELLGIGPGHRVLVPTYHCPTMVAPIERVGAEPCFFQMTDSGTPDLNHLEANLTGPVRAMLVPHLFGIPMPLADVADFCRRHGIALIEDCAHCFFGRADQSPVGTIGDFAIGSLPKFFPLVEGGMLGSAKRSLATLDLRFRSKQRALKTAWDLVDMASRSDRLGHFGAVARGISHARRTFRGQHKESIGAAVQPSPGDIRRAGLADPMLQPGRLGKLEEFIVMRSNLHELVRRRRENYLAIASALSDIAEVQLVAPQLHPYSAPYVVPIIVSNPDKPYARMRVAGLPVFRWDRLWPGTPLDARDATTRWSRGLIQVACHQSLRQAEVSVICEVIRECLHAR